MHGWCPVPLQAERSMCFAGSAAMNVMPNSLVCGLARDFISHVIASSASRPVDDTGKLLGPGTRLPNVEKVSCFATAQALPTGSEGVPAAR